MDNSKNITVGKVILNLILLFMSFTYIIPIILMISISLSSETSVAQYGYSLIPKEFSYDAYKMAFRNPTQIINSYKVTIFYSIAGTLLSMLVMTLTAYPLSRKNYRYRKPVMFFIFFTMLFSGGLVPSYILITKYLHLGNSIWVYILPYLANAWYIIVIRTFFQGLPSELVESAKIDGGSELLIFFRIILPLSKPVLATVSLLTLLTRWNDWNTALLYIRDTNLFSLQYLLQKILREAQFIKSMAESSPVAGISMDTSNIPSETVRYAMCIVAAGPMLVIFPFFQKYFAKGLTVGAVKG